MTETQPASFSRETCNDYRPVNSSFCSTARQIRVDQHQRYQCVEQMQSVSNASCFIGQQIAVDTRYRYQCDQTVQGYESLSCRRGVSVTVGFGPRPVSGSDARRSSTAATASIRTWR